MTVPFPVKRGVTLFRRENCTPRGVLGCPPDFCWSDCLAVWLAATPVVVHLSGFLTPQNPRPFIGPTPIAQRRPRRFYLTGTTLVLLRPTPALLPDTEPNELTPGATVWWMVFSNVYFCPQSKSQK